MQNAEIVLNKPPRAKKFKFYLNLILKIISAQTTPSRLTPCHPSPEGNFSA
jgi:hypothetical protein